MPVNRQGTSRRFSTKTLPPGKFPSGRQLALIASLCGPLLFPLSTTASLPGEDASGGPALPELSRIVDTPAAAAPKLRSRLTGFPGHSRGMSGAGNGAWFQDETRQLQGMGARFQPSMPAVQGLDIEATHLSHAIIGVDPGQEIGQNNAWSLAAHRRLLDNRLLLQGEYAMSRKQREQPGSAAMQGGEAHSLLASYQGAPSTLAGQSSRWGVEISRDYAEAGFWSLARLAHARDRVVDRATGRLGWGKLDAAFSYSRANEVRPAGEPAVAERYTESANLTAHFAPGPWWWEVGHAHTATYRNESGALLNGNDLTNLRLHLPLDARLSLTPEVKWGTLEGPWGNDSMELVMGSLAGSATLVPERVQARLVLRASRKHGTDEARESRMMGIESSLSWALRPPRAQTPGVNLSLRGRYQQLETEGATINPPADYQALARFEFSWARVN